MQNIKEQFKNKWEQEYLAELHGRHKYFSHKRSRNIVKVEDVVIIPDDKIKRSNWRLGTVDEVYKSKDNKVRCVDVRTLFNGKIKHFKRTISLLYPIEVNLQSYETVYDHSIMVTEGVSDFCAFIYPV